MLNDVYIFSLTAFPVRRDVCREKLIAQGVPAEQIKFFTCFWERDYERCTDICEEAIAEGFDFFETFLNIVEHHGYRIPRCDTMNKFHISQCRNYCRFFQLCITENATLLLFQDRRELVISFKDVETYIENLQVIDPDWEYLTLATDANYLQIPISKLEADPRFLCGIGNYGGDWGQIITPKGASVLLNKFGRYLEAVDVFKDCSPKMHCTLEDFLCNHFEAPHFYSLSNRAVDFVEKDRFESSSVMEYKKEM